MRREIKAGTKELFKKAAAPSNSLYVDDGGRVGRGTATPVLDVHIRSNNTPSLRLEQDNSGGFTAQTWDVAANEANFFIRDVTSGSRLPFRIRPGAPTSSIDISASGSVGIGISGPLYAKLHIKQGVSDTVGLRLARDPANGGNPMIQSSDDVSHANAMWMQSGTSNLIFSPWGGNVGIGMVTPAYPLHMGNGAYCSVGGVWTNASSREYKQGIKDLTAEEAEEAFSKLMPVVFAYRAVPEEHHVGFIAEDVPEILATPDRKGLSTMDIVAVLTKVLQEQQKTIVAERTESPSRSAERTSSSNSGYVTIAVGFVTDINDDKSAR